MHSLQTKDHLRNTIQYNGGFTWSPFQATPTTGYMVGIVEISKKPNNDKPLTNDELKFALDYLKSQPENLFLGGWLDEQTGEVYYDISIWYSDRDSAITEAKTQHEKAIFNLETMKEERI